MIIRMKKIYNLALSAVLAMAFTACSDDPYLGEPQVNPQQPIMPADGVKATDVVAEGGSVDLDAAGLDGEIDMLEITRLEDFPSDQTLKIVMNAATTADMADAQPIELTLKEGVAPAIYTVAAPAAKWDEVFKSIVSRDPSAQTMYVDYVAYAVQGTTEVLLGSVGQAQSVVVKPFGYEHPIETTYYFYGTATDGSMADAIQLAHEGNQYDNPVFKVKVEITSAQINADGGWKFKVIPATTKEAGKTWEDDHNLLFIGAGEKDGTLAYSTATADAEWVVVTTPGSYMLNVNILDMTYELTNAIDYLYVPGGGNNWSWNTKLNTEDYINYSGFAYLSGEFKFTGIDNWEMANDYGNYGAGADNNTLLNGSNTNFKVDKPGLYFLEVNLAGLTYTETEIEKIGVVGSLNGWNEKQSIPLTPSADYLTWTGTITLAVGDEWKFNCNGGWAISLGGTPEALSTHNGPNIKADQAGTFLVTLDLSALPYTYTLTPQ